MQLRGGSLLSPSMGLVILRSPIEIQEVKDLPRPRQGERQSLGVDAYRLTKWIIDRQQIDFRNYFTHWFKPILIYGECFSVVDKKTSWQIDS